MGVDGEITAKIVSSAEYISQTKQGFDYQNGTLTFINEHKNTTSSYIDNNLRIEGKFQPYIQSSIDLFPYGIQKSSVFDSSISLTLKNYLALEAVTNDFGGVNFTADLGVKLSGNAHVGIFNTSFVKFDKTFFDVKFLLYEHVFGVPTVSTLDISDLSSTSATGNGTLQIDSKSPITDKGFVWNTLSDPTILNNKVSVGKEAVSTFSALISGLKPATNYHIRAYATNSVGTAYGKDKFITTKAASSDNNPTTPSTPTNPTTPTTPTNPTTPTTPTNPTKAVTASPAFTTYTPFVAEAVSAICPQFVTGKIDAMAVNYDVATREISFQIKRSDNSKFSGSGTFYLADLLCGTNVTTYNTKAFLNGDQTVTIKTTETYPLADKSYYLYIVQPAGNGNYYFYSAPPITVHY